MKISEFYYKVIDDQGNHQINGRMEIRFSIIPQVIIYHRYRTAEELPEIENDTPINMEYRVRKISYKCRQ